MFRDTLTSKPVWLILGLLLGIMIAPNSGGFSPGWFWTIVAFGLGGLVVQLAHLVHGRRQTPSSE